MSLLWVFVGTWALLGVCLRVTLAAADLIQILNGLLAGSLVAVAVVYAPLTWRALSRDSKYPDMRQFSLGRAMILLSLVLTALTSIYAQSADLSSTPLTITALGRWFAIGGCILEVYSPEAGQNVGWGTWDRRWMNLSLLVGGLLAIAAVLAQRYEVMA